MLKTGDVLDFWFDDASSEHWFKPCGDFDQACRERFAAALDAAAQGAFDAWSSSAPGALALTILLDQIPRNIYRGTARAFACDIKAKHIADLAMRRFLDQLIPKGRRMFLYMPYQHSEDASDQARSVALFETLDNDHALDFAIRHKVIIDRFGRFPHRNAILGRESTDEELEFLKQPNSSF